MLLATVAVLLVGILILVGVLLLLSPGKLTPFVDESGRLLAGSIAEKVRVNINGVEQGMFIEGRDATKPVLLFLHGGPGMPEHFLTRRYPTGLEADFVVCWWEQRGSGLSYHADLPPETMTIEQMIADTLAVTNYLRDRFGQDKIYLMGHSGGSFYGIQAAARAPELYHAYIGVAQMTYQHQSEALAYDYMLAQFHARGDAKMVRKLEAAPVTLTEPLPAAYLALRDEAMHTLGIGTTRDMKSVITGVFVPSWLSREYTLAEKVDIWRGKGFSMKYLRGPVFATDLTKLVTKLDLPVYFLHGQFDYTCSYPVAETYFGRITAPVKGFYTFKQSAHSPIFEEPEAVLRVLREDVLTGANRLADVE